MSGKYKSIVTSTVNPYRNQLYPYVNSKQHLHVALAEMIGRDGTSAHMITVSARAS